MLIIKLASNRVPLRLSMLTPPETDIENHLEGSNLKPCCLNLGKRMHSFHMLHLVLVGKRDSFQHVGTKVLALTITHAGTSPGRERHHLAVSIKEELNTDIKEGKGPIYGSNLVLYNTQVQVFVPKTDREKHN